MNIFKLSRLAARRYRDAAGDDDGSGGDAIGSGNDARVALLNSIGASADRERGDEFHEEDEAGVITKFEPEALDASDDVEAQAALAEAQAEQDRVAVEQAAAMQAAPAPIIRKINGVDTVITDELLTKASKIGAADIYLAEAKRLKQEAAPIQKQESTVDDDLADIAKAIQMGTEEEAIAALRKLVPKSPSNDEISRQIDARLTFNEAYSKFTTAYSDIVSDPVLKKLAEDRDAQLVSQGDKRGYYERFKDSGEAVRAWKNSFAPPKAAEPEVPSKLERKAAAPVAPKAAAGKTGSNIQEEVEETTESIIAGMARARGGPQWMNGNSN